MKTITAILIDFADLAQGTDDDIFRRMTFYCGASKRPMLPRNLKYNAYRVTRQTNLLTVHLLLVEESRPAHEVAQFSFAPPPDFSDLIH